MVAIGIKEEASPEIEALAARCHWISLGALSKLIDICHQEGITQVMMCGQVKHAKIFSSIVPDLRLVKLLASIETKNTEGLIGGVVKVLADEGIELVDSTLLLKDLLAPEGVLTRRKPSADEERDIDYGRRIAAALSEHDIGQSVAIAERACVAVEAMEGTDAMLRRAASLVEGKPLRLVEGLAAAEAPAVRRAGGGSADHRCDAGDRHYRAGDRRGADAVAGSGGSAEVGGCCGDRDCGAPGGLVHVLAFFGCKDQVDQ